MDGTSSTAPSREVHDRSVAVVTGAASGIGRRTCELLLDERATVVGVDVHAAPAALTADPCFLELTADVASGEAVRSASDHVHEALGRCDILVNCAGVLVNGTATDTSEDDWDRVMAVNLRGAWLACKAFIPLITTSGGGAIVSVASGTGLRPIPALTAYSASKAGLISLMRSIALDYAAVGIRSNCVCPGPLEEHGGVWPVALAQPDEIARAILLLCSPAMRTLTGVSLAVDSGRSLH